MGYYLLKDRGNYFEDGLFTYNNDAFRKKPRFAKAYARGLITTQGNNPGIEWRIHIATWCATNAAKLEGDFVECGVFVGFISSSVMEYMDWDKVGKTFWLVDTFEGPKVEQFTSEERQGGRLEEVEELRKVGGYRYDVESVRRNFSQWKNVNVIKGVVPEVLPSVAAPKVAYLHIDMNAVVPEIAALRYFWDRLVPGAIVLLDDYAYRGFEEQGRAMDALAAELGVEIASLPTGQGILIKPPAR